MTLLKEGRERHAWYRTAEGAEVDAAGSHQMQIGWTGSALPEL